MFSTSTHRPPRPSDAERVARRRQLDTESKAAIANLRDSARANARSAALSAATSLRDAAQAAAQAAAAPVVPVAQMTPQQFKEAKAAALRTLRGAS